MAKKLQKETKEINSTEKSREKKRRTNSKMESSAPRRRCPKEEKKQASFRAPKGSLDPMWRGCSAIPGQACHVNSLMGQ
jgi:hypothetical protein